MKPKALLAENALQSVAEAALQDSEQQFRVIFEQAAVGVAMIDSSTGRFLKVNQRACEIARLTQEEMLGGTFMDISHPDDLREDLDNMAKLKAGEIRTFTMEKRYLHSDGSITWINLTVSPMWQPGETPTRPIAVVNDITAQKVSEEALRSANQRLRLHFEQTPMAVIEWDLDFRVKQWNPAALTIFGYREEEALGQHASFIVPEAFHPQVDRIWQALLQRNGGERSTNENVCKDGRTILCEWYNTPLIDERGICTGVASLVLDITERKRAEEAVKESVEFRNKLIEFMQDGFSLLDANGVQMEVNPSFCRMTGFRPEELIGIGPPFPYWPEEEYESIGAAFRATLDGDFSDFELIFMRKNGERFPVIVSPSAIRDREGHVMHYLASVKDISDRKRADESLQKSEELYRLLADNTEDIVGLNDTEGNRLYISPSYFRKTGWTPEDLERPQWRFIIHHDDIETVRNARARNLAGEATRIEHRTRCKDGSWLWCDTNCTPLFGTDGKVGRLLVWSHDITKRRAAEVALRESEEKFRTLFENAGDAIFSMEGALFLDGNARALEMFGCQSRDQFVGHPPYMFSPPLQPDGRNSLESAIEKITAALAGQPQFFEWMHTKLDGSPFPAEVTLNKMELGEKVLLQAIVRDISGRKQAEAELKANEQRHRAILDSTLDAIVTMDAAGRVVEFNPTAERMFGYSLHEAVGRTMAELIIPPAFREQHERGLARVVSGGEAAIMGRQIEITAMRRNGMEFPVELCIQRIGEAESLLFIGFIRDITESKIAQQLLSWEKDTMELISGPGSLSDLLECVMRGLEGQAPGALCSILLLDADGVHLRHAAAPSLPEPYNRAIDGVAIGTGVGSCGTAAYENRQVIVSDIASDPLWTNYRELALGYGLRACWSTPIVGSEGKTLGTFAIYYREPRQPVPAELDLITRVTHITRMAIERKRADEKILTLNANLERRVEERNSELRAANKELEAFTYSVSHDLRAPLRAMDGFSRIVVKNYAEQLDDEGRKMLGMIRSGAQQMGRLIDDLLNFSRIGRQLLERVPIDMGSLVRTVFDDLASHDPVRTLQLNLQPLPTAYGTPAMIRQVWVNLISNAIKFTKECPVAKIEIGSRDDEEGKRIFYIRDNGAGFDMAKIDRLFGVFQRLHSTEEFEGTGVGLALVKRIVDRHGGSIWAEGEVNRGATISFTLPNPAG